MTRGISINDLPPEVRACAVDQCERPLHGRGLCAMHLQRLRRRGGVPPRPSLEERIWSKIDTSGGPVACWPWLDHRCIEGYGKFWVDRSQTSAMAHRVAYELVLGPIPVGMTIDHRCHTEALRAGLCPGGRSCLHRRCCNPDHLDPVTHADNVLRGAGPPSLNARKTHCIRGHPLSGANVIVRFDGKGRGCRACEAGRRRRSA